MEGRRDFRVRVIDGHDHVVAALISVGRDLECEIRASGVDAIGPALDELRILPCVEVLLCGFRPQISWTIAQQAYVGRSSGLLAKGVNTNPNTTVATSSVRRLKANQRFLGVCIRRYARMFLTVPTIRAISP